MKLPSNRIVVRWALAAGAVALAGAVVSAVGAESTEGAGAALRTAPAQLEGSRAEYTADASIEAVRDSRIAAQVIGRITDIAVRAGDRVQAGQVLMRIDPSAAAQQVAGSQAQVAQAQAMLTAARSDYQRAQRLYAKQYLSAAALEHAEAQYKAAEAGSRALMAQAAAAGVQAGYYTVRAPYAGWVAQVNVSVGDTAAPGAPLASMYDPAALRVSVPLPESVVERLDTKAAATVELPNAPADLRRQTGVRLTVLPALDAATHSATVRVDLPPQPATVLPGQFARVHFALKAGAAEPAGKARVLVPLAAVVRRGELTGVYVVTPQGAQLRQIRLGHEQGDQVEVLAGVAAGERVALDPVAAAQAAAR